MPLPRLTLVGKPAPANGADDAELARALVRQDPGITFVAWTRLHPAVDGTLRRLMGPGNDIPDIAQEVFLRFFRHVGKLRDPAALRSFLTGILPAGRAPRAPLPLAAAVPAPDRDR